MWSGSWCLQYFFLEYNKLHCNLRRGQLLLACDNHLICMSLLTNDFFYFPIAKFEFLMVNPLTVKAQGSRIPLEHAEIGWFLPAFIILSSIAAKSSSALTAALISALQSSALYSGPLPCGKFPSTLGRFLHAELSDSELQWWASSEAFVLNIWYNSVWSFM